MITYSDLERAFAPYADAMGDIAWAAHMGGFDGDDLREFSHHSTKDLPRRMSSESTWATYAGLLSVGVLLGAAAVRQGRGEDA